MVKKAISILIVCVLVTTVFTACSTEEISEARDYTAFSGKTTSVVLGTICGEVAESINAIPAYYPGESECIEAVRSGKADGFVTDLSSARVITGSKGNEDLGCIEIPAEFFVAPMGALSLDQDIINRFNTFLAELKSDGILDDMQNRWLNTIPDESTPMPSIPTAGEKGELKVAVSATTLPFVYKGLNGEIKGYSTELAMRFAAHEGMSIEFVEMEFGEMIPSVVSGNADFAIANISITEERKKSVLFTDSIYDDRQGIIILKKGKV